MTDSSLVSAGAEPVVIDTFAVETFAFEVAFFLPVPHQRAYNTFVNEVDHWWSYRMHERARCILEPEVGGRWMQTWDNGGALFANVLLIDPPRLLRVGGPLAMTRPAHNVVDFAFEPITDGTTLTVSHRGYGELEDEAGQMYLAGWQELIGESFFAFVTRV